MRNRMLLAAALTWLLASCGGGSGSGSGSNGPFTGNWQIGASSSLHDNVQAFNLSGALQQTSNSISGEMSVSGSPCATSASVLGTATGNALNVQLNFNGQTVNLEGQLTSPTSALGTWQAPAGGCEDGDFGDWSGTKQ